MGTQQMSKQQGGDEEWPRDTAATASAIGPVMTILTVLKTLKMMRTTGMWL
jgi:hypothetical protein